VKHHNDPLQILGGLSRLPRQGIDLQTDMNDAYEKEMFQSTGIDIMLAFLRYGIANGGKMKDDTREKDKQVLDYLWLDWGSNQLHDMKLKAKMIPALLSAFDIDIPRYLSLHHMVDLTHMQLSRFHAIPIVTWALRFVDNAGPRIDCASDPRDNLQECVDSISHTSAAG
jgi:hypothetical protein